MHPLLGCHAGQGPVRSASHPARRKPPRLSGRSPAHLPGHGRGYGLLGAGDSNSPSLPGIPGAYGLLLLAGRQGPEPVLGDKLERALHRREPPGQSVLEPPLQLCASGGCSGAGCRHSAATRSPAYLGHVPPVSGGRADDGAVCPKLQSVQPFSVLAWNAHQPAHPGRHLPGVSELFQRYLHLPF